MLMWDERELTGQKYNRERNWGIGRLYS